MKTSNSRLLLGITLGLAAFSQVGRATDINFPDFSDPSTLQINGNAAAPVVDDANRKVLRLTPSLDWQAGSAFSQNKVNLDNNASFSTFFSFRFSVPQDGGADGMVFVVQNVANNVGTAGGGIGYQGIQHSVGVEFDTFDNGSGLGDPNGNHVAIDRNGDLADNGGSAVSVDSLGQLDQGGVFYSWIDYNGVTDTLEVRLNNVATRPALPTTSRGGLDLVSILGDTDAYVGFTSGTGIADDNHDVLSWGFKGGYDPFLNTNTNHVPESGPGLLGLLAVAGLFGVHSLTQRKARA
jgi:hypothetical protein